MDKRAALTDALPDVMRFARALTRNADTAEDLLHDCVARALSRLHLFEAGTNMRAWLFTILHNLHRQNLRNQSRRPSPASLSDEMAGRIGRDGDQNDRLMLRDFGPPSPDWPRISVPSFFWSGLRTCLTAKPRRYWRSPSAP